MKAVFGAIWRFVKRTDKLLLLLCIAASGLSVVLLYSLTANGFLDTLSLCKTQLIASVLGIGCALVLSMFDYKLLTKLWFVHAPLTLIMVLLTFTPLGSSRAGDNAWLNVGITTIQPSEFLKISFILTFAYHLSKTGENINRIPNMLLLCLHGAVPCGLIALQGDAGTALVFAFMFVCMLFGAGISWKYIAAAVVAAPIAGAVLWFKILTNNQKDRILSVFNPASASKDIIRQQAQGRIALGSGQLSGKGLFGGSYSYVPEIYNDFIFAYIGQTLGFIGCVATVVLIAAICLKLIMTSCISKDPTGKYICIGVFALILFHSIVNIGMVLGVLPVIGIPLPLISSGGTSVLSMYLAIGLAMSVYARKPKAYTMFYNK